MCSDSPYLDHSGDQVKQASMDIDISHHLQVHILNNMRQDYKRQKKLIHKAQSQSTESLKNNLTEIDAQITRQ